MIWAKEETLSREEIKEIQTTRLQETVERVYNTVEPYRKKMDEAGIKPENIRGLEDLHNLPFTTKQDMRDNYPFGLFAVPKKDLIDPGGRAGRAPRPGPYRLRRAGRPGPDGPRHAGKGQASSCDRSETDPR